MSKFSFLAPIVFVLFLCGCGKIKSNEEEANLQPVTDLKSIQGEWLLETMSSKNKSDAISITGTNKLIIRANSTYFLAYMASTISIAGSKYSDVCTAYESGKVTLENGNLILTEGFAGMISGGCFNSERKVPSAMKVEDSSQKVFLEGEKLHTEAEFTYSDSNGTSQKDSIVSVYKKSDSETWDGQELDPRFIGKFKLSKIYFDYWCKSSVTSDNRGELTFKGTKTITNEKDSYEGKENAFAIADNEACTGTNSGSIEAEALTYNTKQESADPECMKETPDPAGYVEDYSRDIVVNGKMVSILVSHQPAKEDSLCLSNIETTIMIGVSDKQ